MTIQLPEEWERYVLGQVEAGRFHSEDDVILDALERHRQSQSTPPVAPADIDPVLGSMREDADRLDEIVEQAMTNRREQPGRMPLGA